MTTIDAGKYLNRDHSTILHYEREHGSLMMLNYYRMIYNKCVNAASYLSVDIEGLDYDHNAVIKELKQENNILYKKVESLKIKINNYKKIQEKLQNLQSLL